MAQLDVVVGVEKIPKIFIIHTKSHVLLHLHVQDVRTKTHRAHVDDPDYHSIKSSGMIVYPRTPPRR